MLSLGGELGPFWVHSFICNYDYIKTGNQFFCVFVCLFIFLFELFVSYFNAFSLLVGEEKQIYGKRQRTELAGVT